MKKRKQKKKPSNKRKRKGHGEIRTKKICKDITREIYRYIFNTPKENENQ